MTEGFELDAAEELETVSTQEQLYHDEREALARVARGLGGNPEAALLARSLKHHDLAKQFEGLK